MLKILIGYFGVYVEVAVEGVVTFGTLRRIAVKVFGGIDSDLFCLKNHEGQAMEDDERVCDHVDESRRFMLTGV